MIYALRYHSPEASPELVELTTAEFNAIPKAQRAAACEVEAYPLYRRADWTQAHAWVRAGNVHNTSLYVDHDNRIRRAIGEFE